MDKAVNIINLAGWTFLLLSIEFELIFNLQNYITADLTTLLVVLRWVQLFQSFDIVLGLLGKTKGSILPAFFQILGRNVVAWFLIEPETSRLAFAGVLVIWSIADMNRYLYYIFKDNAITAFLRYNCFLVLYPAGGLAEMLVINNYINRHPELPQLYLMAIRAIQVMIISGVVILFMHMLKGRKKYMAANKDQAKLVQPTIS